MQNPLLRPANLLLPDEKTDLARWAALACDQFTSEPAYWQEADAYVGSCPSTLHIVLPEVYLGAADEAQRVAGIQKTMQIYAAEVLTRTVNGYIYVERTLQSGKIRQGLVGAVDLEAYSYEPGAACAIRPSENTILERIPPRMAVRRGAQLETPHILMLADDADKTLIEPLALKKDTLALLYDFELMLGGGHIRGWAVTAQEDLRQIAYALAALGDPAAFRAKYGENAQPFTFAVGDGNHSLATAKACWEEVKKELPPTEWQNHPARYCLVELENIQSDAIEIEPIHREVFGITAERLLQLVTQGAGEMGAKIGPYNQPGAQGFILVENGEEMKFSLEQSAHPLAVGTADAFLQRVQRHAPGTQVDYVHGEQSVRAISREGAVGVLLPHFEKSDLFKGVALGGVLPKKTFSMGHAKEKRYYLECRSISR